MNYFLQLRQGLKELEDHPAFPQVFREQQTDFIGYVAQRSDLYAPFIRYLNTLALPKQPMIDLCSGNGDVSVQVFKRANCFNQLTLTDKFPNTKKNLVWYLQHPVDVREMNFRPATCYTMFNALHHFTDGEKLKIAARIARVGSRAFFVEVLQPGPLSFLKVLLMGTLGNLLLTPFVKPFSLTRLVLTYLLPVNLLTVTYDGLVSVVKSRSLREYRKLYSRLAGAQVLRLRSGLSSLIVISLDPVK